MFQGGASDVFRKRLKRVTESVHFPDDVWIEWNRNIGESGKRNMFQLLSDADFAFDFPGDLPWSYRFAEIVHFHTIPVRVNEFNPSWIMPFQHVIDWDAVSLVFDQSVIDTFNESVVEVLRSMKQSKVKEMRRMLSMVQTQCFGSWSAKVHCLLLDVQAGYM